MGEFLLGDKKYCYPLTVTDHASRYLLLCEALESTRESLAFTALIDLIFDSTVGQTPVRDLRHARRRFVSDMK